MPEKEMWISALMKINLNGDKQPESPKYNSFSIYHDIDIYDDGKMDFYNISKERDWYESSDIIEIDYTVIVLAEYNIMPSLSV